MEEDSNVIEERAKNQERKKDFDERWHFKIKFITLKYEL